MSDPIGAYRIVHGLRIHDRDLTGLSAEVRLYSGNPDGVLTAPQGSLCLSVTDRTVYENQDGGTSWARLADAAGTAAAVLAAHNLAFTHADIALNTAHRGTVTGNPHNVTAAQIGASRLDKSNSLNITAVTRNAEKRITAVALSDGRTITPTYDGNDYISSWTDGTNTWTVTRDGDNLIATLTRTP